MARALLEQQIAEVTSDPPSKQFPHKIMKELENYLSNSFHLNSGDRI
jgi:hypothetical protein